MDQLDLAVHATVHSSDKSAQEIAKKIGVSYQVLINKTNFNNETHKLTLAEARAIMIATGDFQILDALERERTVAESNVDLTQSLLAIGSELGDVYSAISEARMDGRVTERERSKIFQEIDDVKKVLQDIESAVNGL